MKIYMSKISDVTVVQNCCTVPKAPLNLFGFTCAIHLKLTPSINHHFRKPFMNFHGDHVFVT